MVHSNHCLTICEVAEESGISKTTCHDILTENLGIHHVAAKFVLHPLAEDQKQNHVDVSKDLVKCANADDNFLKDFITDDETWVYSCDITTESYFS
jgi:cytidylate kinase